MLTSIKTTAYRSLRSQNISSCINLHIGKSSCIFLSQHNFSSFSRKTAEKESLTKKKSLALTTKELLFQKVIQDSKFYREEKYLKSEIKDHKSCGESLFSEGNYQEALKSYQMTYNLLRKSFKEEFSEIAYCIERIGDSYYEMSQWENALNSYEEILKFLKNRKDKDFGKVYLRIGVCYFKEANYSQAISYMKETLCFYSNNKKYNISDDQIICCNDVLSECYVKYNQYDKALNHFQAAIKIHQKKNKNNVTRIEESYLKFQQSSLNYGLSLAYVHKDFYSALNLMRKYKKHQVETNGEESLSAGISHLKIGEVYSLQEKYSKALLNFKKALTIFEKNGENSDRNAGICYKAIGQVYGMQKDFRGCIEQTTKGLKYLEGDFELSECYRNIAFAYCGLREYDKALETLKKSAYVREKALEDFKEADLELMILNGLLAGACFDEKEYSEALTCVELFLKELCKFIDQESQE